jgi:hypothetical protein
MSAWRSVLLMEEPGVPGENHRHVANHWQTLSHNVVSSTPQGRMQDFKLGGGAHLKKIAPSGGRRENFWGISCEKSRFYAKKSYFFKFMGLWIRPCTSPWTGFEITTLVVIGTDWTGSCSCKTNYHTITTDDDSLCYIWLTWSRQHTNHYTAKKSQPTTTPYATSDW